MPPVDNRHAYFVGGLIAIVVAQFCLRRSAVFEGRRPYAPPSLQYTAPRPPPYVALQPDEVRLLAPLATAEHMKCGKAIPPESITRTRHDGLSGETGVTIFVRSTYKVREEADGLHLFSYTVEITNDGPTLVQLMTRHWVVTDETGHVEEVKGPGASGLMALIRPGTRIQYSSSTYLTTASGSMHGSYQFEELSDTDEEGRPAPLHSVSAFNGRVSRLALSRDGRAEKVPCIKEHGRLPLTGVGTAHRLGAGITVAYEPGHSDADLGRYSFSYSVTVSNSREQPVAVVGHEWVYTDALGVQRHERGEGLGGEHSVGKVRLDGQRALNYYGRFDLPTRTGNMEGRLVVSLSQEDEALYYVPINTLGVSADGEPVARIQPLTFLNHNAAGAGGLNFLEKAPPPLPQQLTLERSNQPISTDPGPSKSYDDDDSDDDGRLGVEHAAADDDDDDGDDDDDDDDGHDDG